MTTHEFEETIELARALVAANEDIDDLIEANDLINRAVSLRPDDAAAWLLKAQIMSALDDDIAALAAIEATIRRDPEAAEAHYWHGAILADLERFEDALASVDKAFACLTQSDDWLVEELYYEKALILDAAGRRDAAVETFEQGLERCPESTILRAAMGPLQRERLRASFKVIPGGLSGR